MDIPIFKDLQKALDTKALLLIQQIEKGFDQWGLEHHDWPTSLCLDGESYSILRDSPYRDRLQSLGMEVLTISTGIKRTPDGKMTSETSIWIGKLARL